MQEKIRELVVDVVETNFREQVVEHSRTRPVIVDFWAVWCGPCRTLTPILEGLAEEFGGAFLLARVNTEEAPQLARQFQIQSIPMVVSFRDGKPVDQFIGLLPESEVRRFLRAQCPTQADQIVVLANEKMAAGDVEAAYQDFREAQAQETDHPGAVLGLAQIALERQNYDEMDELLAKISPLSSQADEGERLKLLGRLQRQCTGAGGLEASRSRSEQDPANLEARYDLACCFAVRREYRESLEILLGIVAEDRSFGDDAGRRAMLDVFALSGNRSPLTEEYRALLSRAIF